MYDNYAEELLQQLPDLEGTNWEECRRQLSRMYFALIQLRLNDGNLGDSEAAIIKACDYLRRLANSIEQFLFSEPRHRNDTELHRARSYAFIAAEAIDLWCGFVETIQRDRAPSVELTYSRIESGLLYLASDYQINACCSVKYLSDQLFLDTHDRDKLDQEVIRYLQNVLISLANGDVQNVPIAPEVDCLNFDVVTAARVATMIRIGEIVSSYCRWLNQAGNNTAEAELIDLIEQLLPPADGICGGHFTDLYHLCTLLVHVVRASAPLSVMHHLPRVELNDAASLNYEVYLASRTSHRPFLWPSAKEYVDRAFPGPHADAVVVVPTGSGKSFLAELACSQGMQNGWVLYLAPTNALVNQIQRDLKVAFKYLNGAQVLSFVGGQEYTTLAGELLEAPPNLSVAVMTPEKCAVAFRINPNVFQNCQLCIVDEFHLINDESRGITLDICLAQILTINPATRLLLMSAMVSNGRDVSGWIGQLRNGQEVPLVEVPWRPCRTLRSLLIVNRDGAQTAFDAARLQFAGLPVSRRNVRFSAPLGLLGGMQLQWRAGGTPDDYVSVPVPLSFVSKAKRSNSPMLRGGADWDGWKNTAGTQLSELFSKRGSSVLCFILTSRHHVFSNAENVDLDCDIEIDPHTGALLNLANAELGMTSKVEELLRRGVGVHSSAMLDTEQAAVERCFGNKSINLLLATPTLAQGLNLPADVVVVAGSSLGGAQQTEDDRVQGVRDSDATILNAFGRAGRAMVANHGLAVLVSDGPFFAPLQERVGVDAVVQKYALLSGTDRCAHVGSPIEGFVEHLSLDTPLDEFSAEELELVAQLSDVREGNAEILRKTYGAYLALQRQAEISMEVASGRIRGISDNLVREHNMPQWIPSAALQGGIDVLTCWRLWRAVNVLTEDIEGFDLTDIQNCLDLFIKVMSRMPPRDIRKLLPNNVRAMNTVFDRMLQRIGENEHAVDWEFPDDWSTLWSELFDLVWMYMDGGNYLQLAQTLLDVAPDAIHNRRSQGQAPIPAVFSFVGQVLHHLSILAGAMLVVLEESDLLDGELGEMPSLPLCIRNGCSSSDALAWFRHGYRNRIAAREFAITYPIPAEIVDDGDVKNWITAQRHIWLNGDPTAIESVALRSVWTILSQ